MINSTATTPAESVWRTMTIAVGVALVCSAVVTIAVQQLRPVQAAYAAIERNRAIVLAAGLTNPDADDSRVVDAYLELDIQVMDRVSGAVSDQFNPDRFDHWTAPAEQAERFLPVYLVTAGNRISRVVLPVDGDGMWSRIHGYLAVEPDLNTIAALVIHAHGETPGIGDRIQDPGWLASWQGKRLRDAEDELRIDVSNDSTLPGVHRVDAITGATISARAVGRMIRQRLQDYGAILETLGAAIQEQT